MSENRRYDELKTILEERKRELHNEVRKAVRGVREQGVRRRSNGGHDEAFVALEDSGQEDIELVLIEMKASTLAKVNEALVRLEGGSYGNCDECGGEIAEKRLRALPFAIRCKDCEEAREVAELRERELARRRGSAARMTLFSFDDERV